MLELKIERINDHIIKETYGIVTRTYCTRCGRNLPFLIFECDCAKERTPHHWNLNDLPEPEECEE